MGLIEDGYADSELPDRFKLAIRWADALIVDPKAVTDELRWDMQREFTDAEITELTLTVTIAMGFSKAAIAWGPPDAIPVTEVPTPTPTGSVT